MGTAAPFLVRCLASAAAASWERLVKDLGEECKCRQLAKWSLRRKSSIARLSNQVVPFGEQQQTMLLNSDSTFKAVSRFGNANRFSISYLRWETVHRAPACIGQNPGLIFHGAPLERCGGGRGFSCIFHMGEGGGLKSPVLLNWLKHQLELLCPFSYWLQRFTSNFIISFLSPSPPKWPRRKRNVTRQG